MNSSGRPFPLTSVFTKDPELAPGLSENEYLRQLRTLSFKNKIFRSYIGMGYYNTHVPGVIQRNIFENPGWYTAYTPYQAEIAQGRMEALLNFQTMVCDLTGMELANASLLDEATSAAEAMHMFFAARSREQIQKKACRFFVASDVFPQTLDVLKTRSAPLGIELVSGDPRTFAPDEVTSRLCCNIRAPMVVLPIITTLLNAPIGMTSALPWLLT